MTARNLRRIFFILTWSTTEAIPVVELVNTKKWGNCYSSETMFLLLIIFLIMVISFFLTQFYKRIVVVLVLKVWIWKFLNCNKFLAMFRNAELSYWLAFWIFIYITWFWMRAVVQWNWRQFYGNIQEVRKIYAHVK